MKLQFHTFLKSSLLGPFTMGKSPRVDCLGGWVGSTASVNAVFLLYKVIVKVVCLLSASISTVPLRCMVDLQTFDVPSPLAPEKKTLHTHWIECGLALLSHMEAVLVCVTKWSNCYFGTACFSGIQIMILEPPLTINETCQHSPQFVTMLLIRRIDQPRM